MPYVASSEKKKKQYPASRSGSKSIFLIEIGQNGRIKFGGSWIRVPRIFMGPSSLPMVVWCAFICISFRARYHVTCVFASLLEESMIVQRSTFNFNQDSRRCQLFILLRTFASSDTLALVNLERATPQ